MANNNPRNKNKKRKEKKTPKRNIIEKREGGVILDPSLVDDAIARAISYKRAGEYDKSLRIYENLFSEYGSNLNAGILVGWSKTLAVAGFYDEALQKYELTIKKAKIDKEKERELVYTDQKERLLRREENKSEFEEWLKLISGNSNYAVQEEKEYIKELDDIDIFETDIKFNTADLKKYEEYNDILKDTIEKIKKYSDSIVNFENKIFDKSELDLKNWIYYFEDDIYLPRSFVLGECYFSENNYMQDLYVLIENGNGEPKVIEYIIQPNKINIWNTFEFDFGVINIDFKGDYQFRDRRGKFLFGQGQYDGSTNRIFTYEGKKNYEFIDIEGKNMLLPYGKSLNYNMYHFISFLGFFVSNYEENKEFYWKAINLLLLHESSLIYNNILSPFLIKELKTKGIITEEEQNDLLEVWKNDKKYLQKVSQECTLNLKLNKIIGKTFNCFDIGDDILEKVVILAYDDYYAKCIYNKIKPLEIEDFLDKNKEMSLDDLILKASYENYRNNWCDDVIEPLDIESFAHSMMGRNINPVETLSSLEKNKDEFMMYLSNPMKKGLIEKQKPNLIFFNSKCNLEEVLIPKSRNIPINEKIVLMSGKLKGKIIAGRVAGYTGDESYSVSAYWYEKPDFFDDNADYAFSWRYDRLPNWIKENFTFESFLLENSSEELEKFTEKWNKATKL